jgi:hypothetical protein
METTNNEISPYASIFFSRLSNYLDTKLYFFGSVQRYDYFQSSDIDVDIFSDNLESTLSKMRNFLHVKKEEFKKIIWRLKTKNKVITGYKLMYLQPEHNFAAEFSIYDEKYKDDILSIHNSKNSIPFYATFVLIIAKFLYHTLNVIPSSLYSSCKRFFLNDGVGRIHEDFVVI